MKRLTALLIAAALCAVSVFSVSAIDYVTNPNYQFDDKAASLPLPFSATELSDMIKNNQPVSIEDGAVLTLAHLQAIIDGGAPVTFYNEHFTLIIDPKSFDLNNIKPISLALNLSVSSTASGDIPAGVLVITPAAGGNFGMTFTIIIPKEALEGYNGAKKLGLYYVSSTGAVKFLENVEVNADGSITIEISSGSSYFLSTAQEGPEGPQGPQGPQGPPGTHTPGTPGSSGETGAQGPTGNTGRPGADGNDGSDGNDGRDGRPGADGRPGSNNTGNSGNTTGGGSGGSGGNWWNYGNDRNPHTNVVLGIAGLAALTGAGVVMFLFKKRSARNTYVEYCEEEDE